MSELITQKDLRQVLGAKSLVGMVLPPLLMRLLGYRRLNRLHDKIVAFSGTEYIEALLQELNISYVLKQEELLNLPKEGPFITVSNHAFGGLDGMILLHIMCRERPDFKVVVNFLLSKIEMFKNVFIPVNAFGKEISDRSSLPGLRLAMEHLQQGNALGLFPSGEVSSNTNPEHVIKDIPWHTTIIKIIQKAKVPVVPIYFEGHNSRLFHRLGKINPLLRTARLPAEIINKKGRIIPLCIGTPISLSEQNLFTDYRELGDYLYSRTYALSANIEKECKKEAFIKTAEPVAPAKNYDLLCREVDRIPSNCQLFTIGNYSAYHISYNQCPNLMYEVARKREETFRQVGEGTQKSLDTDTYDPIYTHLILWDNAGKRLVGAYRIGMGADIVPRFGINGFYTGSLFKCKPAFASVLQQSMELGRAFISWEYRYETLPMMLLFKGLLYILIRNPQYRYFIGSVSVSSWYPYLYRSLIAKYLMDRHPMYEFQNLVGPRVPFVPDFACCNPDILLANITTPEKLDRLLIHMSNQKYRLPSLVKRYLKLGCRVVCMNIDVNFNDSLDAFIVMNIDDISYDEIKSLSRDIKDPKLLQRFMKNQGTGS